jgi:hypothetical protein
VAGFSSLNSFISNILTLGYLFVGSGVMVETVFHSEEFGQHKGNIRFLVLSMC